MSLITVKTPFSANEFFDYVIAQDTSNEKVIRKFGRIILWHNINENCYYPRYYSINRNKSAGEISYQSIGVNENTLFPAHTIKKAIALNQLSQSDKAKDMIEHLNLALSNQTKKRNEQHNKKQKKQKLIDELSRAKMDNPLFDVILTLKGGAKVEYFCSYAYYACSKSTSNFIVCRHINTDNRDIFKLHIDEVESFELQPKKDEMN